jgi:hypothetical protein
MIARDNRNWVKEAEDSLYQRYIRLRHVNPPEVTPLVIKPPLDEGEAQYFVRGLKENLFFIEDEGYVQSTLLPRRSGKNTKQKMLQLFWARKGRGWLFREGVCQLATASSLILKYGWSDTDITMEPCKEGFRDFAYGVDILIGDKARDITICGEVKRNQSEFQRLIEGFRYCCHRGPQHTKDQCNFAKNHRKYEFCSKVKPQPVYFFATAPGEEICFKLVGLEIQEEHRSLVYSQTANQNMPTLKPNDQ